MARTRHLRPTVGPKSGSIQGGTAAGPSPATLRALGLQKSTTIATVRQLDANRRRIEKLRREAIKKSLNK